MSALRLRPATWLGLCALVISGCASPNPPPTPVVSPAPAPVQKAPPASPAHTGGETDNDASFDNLDIIDASLNGKVAVQRVGSDVGDNKLLSVFAGLKNKTAHRLVLELETIYKDKDGNVLNGGSWIPMTLKPHEEKEYHSASISLQSVDFFIRVRRAPSASSSTHE
jgi:hypothetical protein